jgi:phage/plasmid-associated DNA primase
VKLREEDKDMQLEGKLLAEAEGILAWAVQGCLEWQRSGLKPPSTITEETEKYRSDEDSLSDFIHECCERDVNGTVEKKQLYGIYQKWSDESGERELSQKNFTKAMKERGFGESHTSKYIDGKTRTVNNFTGIRL